MTEKRSSEQKKGRQKKGLRRGSRAGRLSLVLLEIFMIIILASGCYAVSILGSINRGEISDSIYTYTNNQISVEKITRAAETDDTEQDETLEEEESEGLETESTEAETGSSTAVVSVMQVVEEEEEVYDVLAHQETMNGYWNILLLGTDARLDQTVESGEYRADVIIICSINVETKEIKMASIYRDTIVRMASQDRYIKINDGVFGSYGGSVEEMIQIVNLNFDMDIQDVVMVNWAAMAMVVNDLGGLYLNITDEEVENGVITGLLTEVVNETGIPTNGQFTSGGLQWCDGPKVVAYCRNRQTTGSDFARTDRQREVLELLLTQAKSADIGALFTAVTHVFNNLYTTLSIEEIFALAQDATSYTIGDTIGFPMTNTTPTYAGELSSVYGIKDMVLANDLAGNVKELHSFLFGDDGYEPSENVQTISENIEILSGQ